MLEACIVWGRANGIKILKLNVVSSNLAAIRSYARCGFTVYGVEPKVTYLDGVYHDDLLMSRKI